MGGNCRHRAARDYAVCAADNRHGGVVAVITIDALYWPKPVITRDMRAWAVRAINAGRSNKWVARELGVDEHIVIKTLVMQDDQGSPLVVLMHGDREVSTKQLARARGCKSVEPCPADVAQRHSGYLVGGTSPFGKRKTMPVYLERSALDTPKVFINGGARGFLVCLDPAEIVRVLKPTLVDVGIERQVT
jgi:Cys-tRNA(Pro) deacylase